MSVGWDGLFGVDSIDDIWPLEARSLADMIIDGTPYSPWLLRKAAYESIFRVDPIDDIWPIGAEDIVSHRITEPVELLPLRKYEWQSILFRLRHAVGRGRKWRILQGYKEFNGVSYSKMIDVCRDYCRRYEDTGWGILAGEISMMSF